MAGLLVADDEMMVQAQRSWRTHDRRRRLEKAGAFKMLKAVVEKLLEETPLWIKAVLEEFQLPEVKSEAEIFQTPPRAKLAAESFLTLPETLVKELKKVGYEN